MIHFYKDFNSECLENIRVFEASQFSEFRKENSELCQKIATHFGWSYSIFMYRWTDGFCRFKKSNKQYDGYTATLQIDFLKDNMIVEDNDTAYSMFENITYIYFDYLRNKYVLFQNETLSEINRELKQIAASISEYF